MPPPRFRAGLTLRLTPDDVGKRVSVRRKLPDGGYSDAIGDLESWAEGLLRVRRRDGSVMEIAEDTVVAGKPVPPPPPKRRPRGPNE